MRPARTSLAWGLSLAAVAAWAQTPVLSWGEVVYCNGPDEGDMRPRIALNAQQAPVVLWGDDVPMVNRVAVGDGTSFGPSVEVSAGFMPSVAEWMGSSIAAAGNTLWVVMKGMPEESTAVYVRRSDDGGHTWGDTLRVDPFDGLVSRFPSIAVTDPNAPVVQYMQFDEGWSGARQVVTRMQNGAFAPPVQVSSPFAPGEVCDCCPGQVVADADRVAALYRNAGSDIRVIWGAASSDGGATFPVGATIDTTGWVLGTCPASGPAGYIAGDSLRYVWMSGANTGNKVYLASAALADLATAAHVKVHPGQPLSLQQNFPRIAGNGDTLGVVWQQTKSGQTEILFSWSTTGVNGLSVPDTVNVELAGAQKTPDIAYADGVFHIIWAEPVTGQVRYRKATIGTGLGLLPVDRTVRDEPVWPNPAQHMVHVPLQYRRADVRDANGRIISRGLAIGRGVLDVSQLPSGAYTLELTDGDGARALGRFVKH